MRQLRARFRGRCSACDGPIAIGTTIAIDLTTRRVFHLRCAAASSRSTPPIAMMGHPAGDGSDIVVVPMLLAPDDQPPRLGETMATRSDGPLRVIRTQPLPSAAGEPRLVMITGRRSAAGPHRRWRDVIDD